MLNSPTIAFFVQGIPETIILVLTGLILNNIKYDFGAVIKITLAFTLSAYFVKLLPLNFNVFPLLLIFVLAFFLNLFQRIPPLRSLVISLSTFALQALLENILFWYWQDVLKFDFDTILNVPHYRIIFGLQVPVLMCVLVFIIVRLKRSFAPSHISN